MRSDRRDIVLVGKTRLALDYIGHDTSSEAIPVTHATIETALTAAMSNAGDAIEAPQPSRRCRRHAP